MERRTIRLAEPIDLHLTLGPLRHGAGDPTIRFVPGGAWRATRTPDGPATERLTVTAAGIDVEAWGPGAGWAVDTAPDLVGVADRPDALAPRIPLLRELERRLPGMRMGRTGAVIEALVPTVIEQKVTGQQARLAYARLVADHGEVPPGPRGVVPPRLRLPPSAESLAALPSYRFHPLGIERRRADTLRRACARAGRLEEAAQMPLDRARARLMAIPGIGPWTAAEVARAAFGDPDAVSVGDFHLPHLVAWALAGEPRGTDARMLELLEPWRGQRARVVRLLEASGITPPRYGPRLAPRDIASA